MTVVAIDIFSLLGMAFSVTFTILTVLLAIEHAERTRADDVQHEVYDAIETAEIRVFLPLKNDSEAMFEVIRSRVSNVYNAWSLLWCPV